MIDLRHLEKGRKRRLTPSSIPTDGDPHNLDNLDDYGDDFDVQRSHRRRSLNRHHNQYETVRSWPVDELQMFLTPEGAQSSLGLSEVSHSLDESEMEIVDRWKELSCM